MSLVAPWYLKSSQTRVQNLILCTGRRILIPCTTREVHAPHKNFLCLRSAAFAIPHSSATNLHSLHSIDQPTLLASYFMEITWYSLTFSHPCLATCLYLLTQYFYPVISENNEHCLLSFCLGCCHYTHLNII